MTVLPTSSSRHNTQHLMPPVIAYSDLIEPHHFFPKRSTDRQKELIIERLFKPRMNATATAVTFPIDWSGEAFGADRNTRMHLHAWTMLRPASECFDTCDSAEQQQMIAFFFDVMRDWYERYGSDPDNIVTSRMPKDYAWYDMSVGFRAIIIGFFRNRIAHFNVTVSEEDADLLEKVAQKHIRHLSNPDVLSLNNHGIWQMHGLTALIVTSRDPHHHLVSYAAALDGMQQLVSAQFDYNGVHTEHSPHYHIYALNTFRNVFTSGWYGADSTAALMLDKATTVTPWLLDPLQRPACIGDSVLTIQPVAFPDADAENTDSYIRSDFDDSGYHIIRSAWDTPAARASYMFFMAAYHSKTHKHRDCLSFEWFEAGRKIICDGGKYAYTSDIYRHYFLSEKAHNSVEIERFNVLKKAPYGSALTSTGMIGNAVYTIHGTLSYPDVTFNRSIYYRPRRWMIIKDTLLSKRVRMFTQWFHLEKGYQLISDEGNRLEFCHDDDRASLMIRCLTKYTRPSIVKGDENHIQGFISEKDCQLTPAYAVSYKDEGKKGEFLTVLSLSESDEQDALRALQTYSIGEGHQCTIPDYNNMLPHIPTMHFPLKNGKISPDIREGKTVYFIDDGAPADMFMYSHIKPSIEHTLTVLLPGAVNRKTRDIDFQRYSWSGDIEGHVISLSDPTITTDNTLGIGWFQGTEAYYGIHRAYRLISHMCDALDIAPDDLYIFGSSAGGFSALQLGALLPQATIGAINPQIILANYSKRFVDDMLTHSYAGLTIDDMKNAYPDRMQVHIHKTERQAPAYVFQNIVDKKHLVGHIGAYIKELDPSFYAEHKLAIDAEAEAVPDALLNVEYYNDPENGHSPPGKEETLKIIAEIKERSAAFRA